MKLGEFLTNVPPATGSGTKEKVEFRLIGISPADASALETRGYACYRLVSDYDHEEGDLDALKSLKDVSKELGIVPDVALTSRERAQLLSRALRDYDNPKERFATADELQKHVPREDLEEILKSYRAWVQKNYPSRVTKQERTELFHQAVGKLERNHAG